MATKAEIAAQYQLEEQQITQGLYKLRSNTNSLEEKDYASATEYGSASIKTLLPLVTERIEATTSRIHERKNGVAFKEIHSHLAGLDAMSAAAIACKITFDKVFSYNEDNSKLAKVTESIGRAIEDECQLRHYQENCPGLLKTLKDNYWHQSSGTQQRAKSIRTLMAKYDVKQWVPWSSTIKSKLGAWLLECIIEASGWFTRLPSRNGRKTTNYVRPTPEFIEIKDQVMHNAELFSPLAWPMLIEPNPWSNDRPGGYIMNEVMRGHDMVRRGANDTPIQGETPIQFLNHIQRVPFTLNKFVVGVARELEKKERAVGKFLPIVHHDLPPKPVDIADNADSRKDYRRRATEVLNKQAQEFRKSCRTRMTMEAVNRFYDVKQFFIPWSLDYRGRAYPIPAFLTPQDTDFGKSLLKFAEGAYVLDGHLDEDGIEQPSEANYWLAFQVATTFGLDKAPMSERQKWVANNWELIERIATDPIGNLHEWEVADEPWLFLAACEEYYACIISCTRHFTSLPVAVDATCSGLQILAGLARDKSTARLVNVLPGSQPQDAYKVVAEEAKPFSPVSIQPYMDRKTVKRVVMTVPYNAKPYSNRQYIKDALKDKGVEIDKDDLTATVKAVREAMDRVVPGPMSVMKWIEDEVAKAIKRGAQYLQWRTPSGFVVRQKLMKPNIVTVNLQLLGRCTMKVADGYSDKVDLAHHKNATAPNLIHSLDASLLHISALEFNKPLALIHDSVLCRAADMFTLSQRVRKTYMYLFAEHDYLTRFAEYIEAETEPPIIGDLDPEIVEESTYFFC